MSEKEVTPVWCVVANIVRSRPSGHGGVEQRLGTKHFAPGTKVHIRNVYWGMGGEDAEVIGRHRGGSQVVAMVVRTAWLTNLRVKMVYDPSVVAKLIALPGECGTTEHGDHFCVWDGSAESKVRAERIAGELSERVAALKVTSVVSGEQ